jgi:hypothetical protein
MTNISLFAEISQSAIQDFESCPATMHPAELKKFYKPGPIGRRKIYITNCEISRLLALNPNSFQAYLRMPGQKNYREPNNTVRRCAWYIAQILKNNGWEFDGELE